jgi:ankyrin repeat protein
MIAARLSGSGRSEIVRLLVDAKADTDAQSPYGDTAIQFAAERGYTDTVLLLKELGARNRVQSGLDGALINAARGGRLSEVRDLLKHGANPNAQPIALKPNGEIAFKGDTPLIEATKAGHRNVVSTLLQNGAHPDLQGSYGKPALSIAVQRGEEITKLLLDSGANPNTKDDLGKTPLMHTLESDTNESQHTARMRLLIIAGADVNTRDRNGKGIVYLAIASGNSHVVSFLGANGARVDRSETLLAAAEFASKNGFSHLQKLFTEGDNLDARDKDGLTALMHVARHGHARMLKTLLYAGSKPNLQDNNGLTPLMHASRYRNTDTVKALLAAGAAPNMKDKKGTTALMMAIPTYWATLNPDTHKGDKSSEGPNTVQTLLDGGADPNATDADGLTPLIFAAGRGRAEIAKILLAHGANLNAKATYGITAHHVAAGAETVELLRDAKAKKK